MQTGVGSVLNTAKVTAGSTVLVMGLGGVGLSVVQGARIAKAEKIIASDPVKERRSKALKLGATNVIDIRRFEHGSGYNATFLCFYATLKKVYSSRIFIQLHFAPQLVHVF